jgi:phage/plasmid-associated DNA primase
MMAFVNAVPESAAMVMDLVAEAQDWPQASEFARRFEAMLPDNLKPQDENDPEAQQRAMQEAEMQQMQVQMAMQQAQLEMQLREAEIQETLARAEQLRAQAAQSIANAEARTADVDAKNAERAITTALEVSERTD